MEFPENKLSGFIQGSQKAKWRPVNNHNINSFTEDEIRQITSNYSNPIAKGGFGHVYRGALDDGTPVAVKKYICQNLKEGFAKEITVHCQINHKNVVRLLGYCSEESYLMIVTEYVSGGNLGDLLHASDDPISLDVRLRIATECADALGYMHSSMYQPIIHGDIKPDNILLDSTLSAKLSDFGLSRLLTMDKTQYTINVAGSRGYMDPEHIETGLVDPKSDVYSFGVVLLELITRAKVSENGFPTGLKRNFTDALRKGKKEARKIFDAEITNERNIKILDRIGNLAAECFTKAIKERPEMKEVQERLQLLRRDLHREQAQEKISQKLSILDIFSRNARRKYFERNAGFILQETAGLSIFTKESIQEITRHFSTIVGGGSSGSVYMGWFDGNRVVVKRALVHDDIRYNFADALCSASRIYHKNIIRLVGCCLETDIPMLVYEFASSGSLHNALHGNGKSNLSLGLRLDIAIGSAEALAYLHSGAPTKILHGFVSSWNVLLDHDFAPKISDILDRIITACSEYSIAVGYLGYVDPVYVQTGRLTTKSDVYSFGIILLELVTRKQAKNDKKQSLVVEYLSVWKDGNSGKAMFDMDIAVEGNIFVLEEMGKLAVECLEEDADERPEMVEVAERLKKLRSDWKLHGEEIAGGH